MSGLLHRLANQAMGTGVAQVHAAARSRFGEPLIEMTEEAGPAAPPGLQRVPDRMRERTAHSDAGATTVPEETRAAGIARSSGEERAFRPPESAEVAAFPMPVITPADATPRDQITLTEIVDMPRREPRHSMPARVVDVPASEAPPPRVPQELVEHRGPVRTAPITPPRPKTDFDRPFTSERAAEPNEVHVHIGRIEVTAVTPPAPPKRAAPAPVRKSLSLEDYLAQRQRRPS